MVKGKQIKDDSDLNSVGLKAGMTIMMMGTAEGVALKEPEAEVKFFEDMTPEEQAKVAPVEGDNSENAQHFRP